jgi:hypothetical protein
MPYSKILMQHITVNHENQTVATEDGAIYTRAEMQAITGLKPEEIRGLHRVKRQFKGAIQED